MRAGMGEIAWRPPPDALERSRIGRFMRAHGVSTVGELHRRSVADPAWYWDAVVRHLGVRFMRPYSDVLDLSLHPPGSAEDEPLLRALELFGTKVLPRIRDI